MCFHRAEIKGLMGFTDLASMEGITMPNDQIEPCKCGFLESSSKRPDSPIRFDPKLNEYHFVHLISTGVEAKMMIYHCPFCGGRAPKSRRGDLFHRLTEAERRRLLEMTEKLETLDEVIAAFGQPDFDMPSGSVSVMPEREGKPEVTESCRVLQYTKLSDTANVHVNVYPTNRVRFSLWAKEIKRDKNAL